MALDPDTLHQLGAGASGSAAAVWLSRATGWDRAMMFVAGWGASYFTAPAVSRIFSLSHGDLAVLFMVGFLAIMVLRKIVAVIDSFPAESVGGVLFQKLRSWLGVKNDDAS